MLITLSHACLSGCPPGEDDLAETLHFKLQDEAGKGWERKGKNGCSSSLRAVLGRTNLQGPTCLLPSKSSHFCTAVLIYAVNAKFGHIWNIQYCMLHLHRYSTDVYKGRGFRCSKNIARIANKGKNIARIVNAVHCHS